MLAKAVAHRVVVHIIDQARVVIVVADAVVAVVALPDGAVARAIAKGLVQRLGKRDLDGAPARRAIVVARRQGPDRVRVVRQHDPGIDVERFADARLAHRFAESRKVVREEGAAPVEQAHREEKSPARDAVVAVCSHEPSLPNGAAMPCRYGANARA
jgi:hypothetical protein